MRRSALAASFAALAAVAACGSTAKVVAGTTGTPTPAGSAGTVTDTVVPPVTTVTTAATTAAPSGPSACTTTNLTVSLGTPEGTAGSAIYPLHLTNKGTAACTVTGYPGVSFVAPGSGAQVGKPASRSPGSAPTVTLSPGAEATAELQVTDYLNYPPSSCAATPVAGLRVYPPANTASAFVAFTTSTRACSTQVPQLTVQTLLAGPGQQ